MSLVSENIGYMEIFTTVPLGGRQMGVGSSTTAIFGDFGGYFFGNVTDETICIHGDMLHMKFVAK